MLYVNYISIKLRENILSSRNVIKEIVRTCTYLEISSTLSRTCAHYYLCPIVHLVDFHLSSQSHDSLINSSQVHFHSWLPEVEAPYPDDPYRIVTIIFFSDRDELTLELFDLQIARNFNRRAMSQNYIRLLKKYNHFHIDSATIGFAKVELYPIFLT